MSSAQDHKARAKRRDQGLNTGGMGNFSPSPFYTEEVDDFCKNTFTRQRLMPWQKKADRLSVSSSLDRCSGGRTKVLEYNACFGDPRHRLCCRVTKIIIIDVMEACVDGKLDTIDLQFEDNAAVCVVLASDGYPVSYEKMI